MIVVGLAGSSVFEIHPDEFSTTQASTLDCISAPACRCSIHGPCSGAVFWTLDLSVAGNKYSSVSWSALRG